MKARFAIDTEFNEFGGDLISLALVDIDDPDEKPFYEVLKRYKLALDKLGDDVIYLAREERFDDHRV